MTKQTNYTQEDYIKIGKAASEWLKAKWHKEVADVDFARAKPGERLTMSDIKSKATSKEIKAYQKLTSLDRSCRSIRKYEEDTNL